MSKKSKKTKKTSKKSSSKKDVSATASLISQSKEELSSILKDTKKIDASKKDLHSAISEAIDKLEPISKQVKDKKATKKDLESAIQEVIGSLIPVTEEDKKYAITKKDLVTEIKDVKTQLIKAPETTAKKRVLKKDLESAIQDVIASLKPVSESTKKRSLSKKDLELAINDAISSLRPVADDQIRYALEKQDLPTEIRDTKSSLKKVSTKDKRHALEKQDLSTEIRDTKAGLKKVSAKDKRHALEKKDKKPKFKDPKAKLKPVLEEVKRPQLSAKQLRTAIKDSRASLQPIPEEVRNLASATLGESIKEEGDKIKRELLPIPGDVEIFEINNIEHISEYLADKSDLRNIIDYWKEKDKKPLLKITINPRTQFNKIELIDEGDPISIDNLIMGGDLVQFGQAYRFLLKYGYIRIENPYPLIMNNNQWYVWHLKEEINLTFIDIAYASNTSVGEVRSIFRDADESIKQILDFAVYGGHYQLVAAHAMKKRGVLIQKVGDTVIEPQLDEYAAEEYLLKELLDQGLEEVADKKIPKEWSIKAGYKMESFIGGRYLWKEWQGALNNDKLLMMDNYALPTEKNYLREAIGFGANITPNIPENFKKLISIFGSVPEELIKIGNAAYFIGNIDSLYASQFWNYNSFQTETSVKDWRKQFIKLAIKAYKAALKKYTIKNYPLQFAQTNNDLGNLYSSLAEIENKVENCHSAMSVYKEALKIYTPELFVSEYSLVSQNLGLAYQTLSEIEEKEVNSKLAIFIYKEAIKGRDLVNHPFEHAVTLVNQGIAYQTMATLEENEFYSTFAIDSYNSALRTGSLDKMITEQAMIYSNIGISYRILSDTQETKHNCSQAVLALNDALTVRNQAQFPFEYAITTSILGDVYGILASIENLEENCQLAISAYDKATKIFIKKHEDFYDNVIKKKKQIVALSKKGK
ncbi:MAG: hypothetical protein V3V41_03310 [Candidatus Heimdallarchaeota archaeon]